MHILISVELLLLFLESIQVNIFSGLYNLNASFFMILWRKTGAWMHFSSTLNHSQHVGGGGSRKAKSWLTRHHFFCMEKSHGLQRVCYMKTRLAVQEREWKSADNRLLQSLSQFCETWKLSFLIFISKKCLEWLESLLRFFNSLHLYRLI
jgi:hypothetical protein